jgi:hypothetical protein
MDESFPLWQKKRPRSPTSEEQARPTKQPRKVLAPSSSAEPTSSPTDFIMPKNTVRHPTLAEQFAKSDERRKRMKQALARKTTTPRENEPEPIHKAPAEPAPMVISPRKEVAIQARGKTPSMSEDENGVRPKILFPTPKRRSRHNALDMMPTMSTPPQRSVPADGEQSQDRISYMDIPPEMDVSPAKSMTSIADDDSSDEEQPSAGPSNHQRNGKVLDAGNFTLEEDSFEPIYASTQHQQQHRGGQVVKTNSKLTIGVAQSQSQQTPFTFGYNSQFNVEGNVDEVSRLLERDVDMNPDDAEYYRWMKDPSTDGLSDFN